MDKKSMEKPFETMHWLQNEKRLREGQAFG